MLNVQERYTSLHDDPEYVRPASWNYGVVQDRSNGDGLRDKTGIVVPVTLTDQWVVVRDLTHYEALQQAAEMIRGAGVRTSTRPEDIGQYFAALNKAAVVAGHENYSGDYNLYHAVIVSGATQEQFSEALDALVQASNPSLLDEAHAFSLYP